MTAIPPKKEHPWRMNSQQKAEKIAKLRAEALKKEPKNVRTDRPTSSL